MDFNYEVSRSLVACEGAILVVDVASGNRGTDLANVYLALDHDLEVMPVINKLTCPVQSLNGLLRKLKMSLDSKLMMLP